MQVIASAGLKVPMEDKPQSYINDTDIVIVDETAYYLRRVCDGDLIVVDEKVDEKKKETK